MKDFFVLTANGIPIECPPPKTIETVGFDIPEINSAIASPASISPPIVLRMSNKPETSLFSSIATILGIICSYFVVLVVVGKV
jgi:hypothetical protein